MSQSSGSGFEGLPYVSKTISREPPPPESAPQSPALLEAVLHATLTICASDEPLDPSDVQRLRDVARRYADCRTVTEPILVELVRAVLEGHFAGGDVLEGIGPVVATRIAQTLLDDPAATARIERFWNRLVGEAP
jgi:hypothetical protein